MKIGSVPGLGAKSQAMLAAAGIETIGMLHQLGSVQAYVMVKRAGCRPSLNLLWALEGAITGVSWQEVARTGRTSLLLALDEIESNG